MPTLAVEGVKFSKAHAIELDQTSDVKASNAGINEFRSEVLEDIKSESLKDQKVTNAHESNDLGCDEKVRVEGTKAPGCELTKAGCDGQTVMVGVREIQNLDDKMAVGECISIDNMADVGKSDDCSDSILKMSGDAGSCFPSSVAVTDGCMEKSVDNAAGIAEVDRITEQEQHATVSAVDIVDSRSQSESLEGNCGSVSGAVLPAVLEASTASDMAALHQRNPKHLHQVKQELLAWSQYLLERITTLRVKHQLKHGLNPHEWKVHPKSRHH